VASHVGPPALYDPSGDADGDEIANGVDACADKPEDFDLHEDRDGCPDLDDDRDGVPDLDDQCFDLPGTKAERGCPPDQECVFVTDITDCWGGPIWFENSTPDAARDQLARVVADIKQFPEIREITLSTQQTLAQPPGTATTRLFRITKELESRGVPASLLRAKEDPPADAKEKPRFEVHAFVTKQRFTSGPFRETLCAGDMGAVYRPSREKNYGCKPQVCGNHRCGGTEDEQNCPQDCL
jgi:hypothetical protein